MMDRHNKNSNKSENGNGPTILALEIEGAEDEEHESLIHEITMDEIVNGSNGPQSSSNNDSKEKTLFGRNADNIRRRVWGDGDGIGRDGYEGIVGTENVNRVMNNGKAMIQGFVRSDLMQHAVYHLRNFLVLAILAFFVIMVLEWEGGVIKEEKMEDVKPNSPHTFTYGGKNNMGHNVDPNTMYKPPPMTKQEELENLDEEILMDAFETRGAWDLSSENVENEEGNYLHDSQLSPFASDLYDADQDELDARQEVFTTRMDAIIQEYGVWNNPNFADALNLDDDLYDSFDFRDVPIDEFPDDAWQKDPHYIAYFLDQAEALVEAMKEGIMQEYNHPNPDDDEKDLFGVIIGDDHDVVDGSAYHQVTKNKQPGVAFLPQKSWDGLVKKLLHAMITTDYFYVVVAGTEESYRANNFAQTQVMQFNHLMEPVFNKLGMNLISRNMAAGGSTAVSAIGGADIYGETDILWHVQDPKSEERTGEFDLLQKQTIMSGERIPVILSPSWNDLIQDSKGKAWVGNLQPGADVCQVTTMLVLPEAPACHGVHCDADAWEDGKCHVYDSVCWEPRSDWDPLTEQNADVGYQDNGYPGFRRHQLEGRKLSLLVLHALTAALSLWREHLESDTRVLPLEPEYWHVKDDYVEIRESVMSLDRIPGEAAAVPACEQFIKSVDARICHLAMKAYTQWTPRVIPDIVSLVGIVNNLIVGEVESEAADVYDGPDILPLNWEIKGEELDVHMIAIAANVSKGGYYDDDTFAEFDFDDDWDFRNRKNSRNIRKLRNNHESRDRPNRMRYLKKKKKEDSATVLEPITGHKLQISEGSGWALVNAPVGFCDGSAQSRCNRVAGNKCLLANHNHYRASIAGTPKNNWLTMRVQNVRHGIILARLEFDDSLPKDFVFDFAINGLGTSIHKAQLYDFAKKLVTDLTVYPLLVDADAAVSPDAYYGMDYDVAIRIRSNTNPDFKVHLTHIYYA